MRKMRILKLTCLLVVPILALLPVTGCGGDGGNDDGVNSGQALNVAGTWLLASEGNFPATLNLAHNGTTVSGTIRDAENYAVRITGTTASPAGTTEGSRSITLVVTYSDGQVVTFNGTVAGDNNAMSGAYSSNWGGADSWSATRQ